MNDLEILLSDNDHLEITITYIESRFVARLIVRQDLYEGLGQSVFGALSALFEQFDNGYPIGWVINEDEDEPPAKGYKPFHAQFTKSEYSE